MPNAAERKVAEVAAQYVKDRYHCSNYGEGDKVRNLLEQARACDDFSELASYLEQQNYLTTVDVLNAIRLDV